MSTNLVVDCYTFLGMITLFVSIGLSQAQPWSIVGPTSLPPPGNNAAPGYWSNNSYAAVVFYVLAMVFFFAYMYVPKSSFPSWMQTTTGFFGSVWLTELAMALVIFLNETNTYSPTGVYYWINKDGVTNATTNNTAENVNFQLMAGNPSKYALVVVGLAFYLMAIVFIWFLYRLWPWRSEGNAASVLVNSATATLTSFGISLFFLNAYAVQQAGNTAYFYFGAIAAFCAFNGVTTLFGFVAWLIHNDYTNWLTDFAIGVAELFGVK